MTAMATSQDVRRWTGAIGCLAHNPGDGFCLHPARNANSAGCRSVRPPPAAGYDGAWPSRSVRPFGCPDSGTFPPASLFVPAESGPVGLGAMFGAEYPIRPGRNTCIRLAAPFPLRQDETFGHTTGFLFNQNTRFAKMLHKPTKTRRIPCPTVARRTPLLLSFAL